ncbi:MAG: hypothetical protein ABEJ30_06145 [Halorientalis sp.]
MRGQTSLPALGVALLLLTTATGLGLAFAEGAFASAERDPGERRVAVALSERLVDPAAPLTDRANVLNRTSLGRLNERRLRARYPVVGNRSVRVRAGGDTVVAAGQPGGGSTVRRIVQVRTSQRRSYEPRLTTDNRTTLPRRTSRVRIRMAPPPATTVQTVRANGRVALHAPTGLRGTATIRVSRFETTTLRFVGTGNLSTGDVTVTYFPARTTKTTLEVTVGD